MTDISRTRLPATTLTPADVVCPDSLGRYLLEVAARAALGHTGSDLKRVPMLGRRGMTPPGVRHRALADDAGGQAVQGAEAGHIDAEAVAEWITGHFPAVDYPAVVLGSPHGAAVHLAAALGAPWLPTGFTVTVHWPGGSVGDWAGAATYGAWVAGRILAANPSVTVRQVHDPVSRGPLCATTITLEIRWSRLPSAYQRFLSSRLRAGGASLLMRDTRTWQVLDVAPGHTFQIGSSRTGWQIADYTADNPAFRRLLDDLGESHWPAPYVSSPTRYAESAGDPRCEPDLRKLAAEHGHLTYRALYQQPQVLSACVADIYRDWLRCEFGSGDGCVVETGTLLDPRQVLAAGLVPYWCESASQQVVAGAEWWLAGSRTFATVSVLPQPPGVDCSVYAAPAQWRSLARFGRQLQEVDRLALSRYPLLPLPTSHTTGALRRSRPADVPTSPAGPRRMSMARAMAAFRQRGATSGMLVL